MSCKCIIDNSGNLAEQIRQYHNVTNGYQMPEDGIPPTDLSQEVIEALNKAISAYQMPEDGIPPTDLSQEVIEALNKANAAYENLVGGLHLSDLSQEVVEALNKANAAYEKPDGGIPLTDLSEEVRESIANNLVINIEEESVQNYLNLDYNNGDYSYTYGNVLDKDRNIITQGYLDLSEVIINGTKTHNYKYAIPTSVEISLPRTDSTKVLEVADNNKFLNKTDIVLLGETETYSLSNFIPNKNYYYRVTVNNAVVENSEGMFSTKGRVRFLKILANRKTSDGGSYKTYLENVRDLGGWKTCDNRKIRYGQIIRGCQLDKDALDKRHISYISKEGIKELLALGIKAELDIRGKEYTGPSKLGEGVELVAVSDYINDFSVINIYHFMPATISRYVAVFRIIINWLKQNKPIYVHCAGGVDRTGLLCMLLEGLLGVSENDLNKDYELSGIRTRNLNRPDSTVNYTEGAVETPTYIKGNFKETINYIKNIITYDNHLYTKVRSYYNSKIQINDSVYNRDVTGNISKDNVIYFKWASNGTVYYTTDIYPNNQSVLYTLNNENFTSTNVKLTDYSYDYYFKVNNPDGGLAPITEPTPITDAELITELEAVKKPSLKEQFRLLLSLSYDTTQGLTDAEYDELEQYLLV